MDSQNFPLDEIIVARFDRGEDLLQSILHIVSDYDVTAGMFTLIGAVDRAQVGFYNPQTRTYTSETWAPDKSSSPALEILTCVGNVARLNGEPIVHGHITLKGEMGETIGGHLMEGCRVNPTGELTLLKGVGTLQRKRNEELQLALLSI
jgi:predicted DNA-binding protein with PD1-like motif